MSSLLNLKNKQQLFQTSWLIFVAAFVVILSVLIIGAPRGTRNADIEPAPAEALPDFTYAVQPKRHVIG